MQEAIMCKAHLACVVCAYLGPVWGHVPREITAIKCNEIESRGSFKIIAIYTTIKYDDLAINIYS